MRSRRNHRQHGTCHSGGNDAANQPDQLSTYYPLKRVRLARGDAAPSLRFVLAILGCTDVAKYTEEDAHAAHDARVTAQFSDKMRA